MPQRMEIEHLVAGQKMNPAYRCTGAMRAREAAVGLPAAAPLLAHFDEAIAAQHAAAAMEQAWEVQEKASANLATAPELHKLLVACVVGLRDRLVLDAKVRGPGGRRAAQKLLSATAPDGVRYITAAPFRDAVLRVRAVVRALATPACAPAVRLLRLRDLIERLGAAADDLEGALSRQDGPRVSWADVTAADDGGVEAMSTLVARILGQFPTNLPADIDARRKLLGPIFAEEDKLRALRRQRKTERAARRAAVAEVEATEAGSR